MKETCPIVEELKEIVKEFMEIQIGVNDAVNEDFEDLTKELTERDKDITYMITDLHHRVIAIEDNKTNNKVNCEINNLYHRLKEDRRRNNESFEKINEKFYILFDKVDMLESRINAIAQFAHNTDNLVRAICADLDKKERRKRNASNK